ncbi:DUF1273 domain-containing protein [Ligilactobacillus cholophilus]|uniref:DUF1273 domain-containing protein n=1 Tax=Ligilactobacillus cholophilus TaxID=3050131 RepID=UPI003EC0D18C
MRLWVSGYRNYELGIFSNNDPKVTVIKYLLKKHFESKFNEGLEWIISSGQLGIEQLAIEVALEMKADYPELKTSIMYPFNEFGNRWNETNQAKLHELEEKVDFCASVSNSPYESVQQLKNFQKFMLTHTDQATLIYDPEYPGKSKFDFVAIKNYSYNHRYKFNLFNMDDLQSAANEFQEKNNWQND